MEINLPKNDADEGFMLSVKYGSTRKQLHEFQKGGQINFKEAEVQAARDGDKIAFTVYKKVSHVVISKDQLANFKLDVDGKSFPLDINAPGMVQKKSRAASAIADTRNSAGYIEAHNIQDELTELIKVMLREKPENPWEFLHKEIKVNLAHRPPPQPEGPILAICDTPKADPLPKDMFPDEAMEYDNLAEAEEKKEEGLGCDDLQEAAKNSPRPEEGAEWFGDVAVMLAGAAQEDDFADVAGALNEIAQEAPISEAAEAAPTTRGMEEDNAEEEAAPEEPAAPAEEPVVPAEEEAAAPTEEAAAPIEEPAAPAEEAAAPAEEAPAAVEEEAAPAEPAPEVLEVVAAPVNADEEEDDATTDAWVGKLDINVKFAQDLSNADTTWFGKKNLSDPYVLVRVPETMDAAETQMQHTDVVNDNLSPEFPEKTLSFNIAIPEPPAVNTVKIPVTFKVFDKDVFIFDSWDSDELLGEFTVPMRNLVTGSMSGAKTRDVVLNGQSRGKVHFEYKFTPAAAEEEAAPVEAAPAEEEVPAPAEAAEEEAPAPAEE